MWAFARSFWQAGVSDAPASKITISEMKSLRKVKKDEKKTGNREDDVA